MYRQKKISLMVMCEPIEVQLLRFNALQILKKCDIASKKWLLVDCCKKRWTVPPKEGRLIPMRMNFKRESQNR